MILLLIALEETVVADVVLSSAVVQLCRHSVDQKACGGDALFVVVVVVLETVKTLYFNCN